MQLSNLQNNMKEFLLSGGYNENLTPVMPDSYSDNDRSLRLGIYKNNVYHQLKEALKGTYSTVNALVGEEFFGVIAQRFIKEGGTPSFSSLIYYGIEFADYLKNCVELKSLPYIYDVAIFDWAWSQSFFSYNDSYLNPEELTIYSERELEEIKFKMHPSLQMIQVNYPAYEIWQWVETGANDSPPEIEKGEYKYALWRNKENEVMVAILSDSEWQLWKDLSNLQSLKEAIDKVEENNKMSYTEKLVGSSVISGIKNATS